MLFFTRLALVATALLALPWAATAQQRTTTRTRTTKTTTTKKPVPGKPPGFIRNHPAPEAITPPTPPLDAPLTLTRHYTYYARTDSTFDTDTIRVTLRYLAPGEDADPTVWKLHDPDDRQYGTFTPSKQAHLRWDEQTPQGMLTRYYLISGFADDSVRHVPRYRTTCAVHYPPNHPSGPRHPQPGYLELDFHPRYDLLLDPRNVPPTVIIHPSDVPGYHRYQ